MKVESLWRYPVKSMQGESCGELRVENEGVAGDRGFGVFNVATGTVISAKRDGRLLEAAAKFQDGELVVRLPDGQEYGPGDVLDRNLTHWLGHPAKLTDARRHGAAIFESQEDFERDDSSSEQWEGIYGSFVDESPLHLLATSELALLSLERPELQWNVRRFRPNIVVDAQAGDFNEVESGQRIAIGEVEIEIWKGCTRCVMTTRPQPGGLARELDILRHVIKSHGNLVGQRATVTRTGVVHVGDAVHLL